MQSVSAFAILYGSSWASGFAATAEDKKDSALAFLASGGSVGSNLDAKLQDMYGAAPALAQGTPPSNTSSHRFSETKKDTKLAATSTSVGNMYAYDGGTAIGPNFGTINITEGREADNRFLWVSRELQPYHSLPEQQQVDILKLFTQASNFEFGRGVLKNEREALRLYKQLANDYKHAGSQYHLGMMYLENRGGAVTQQEEGLSLLHLACDQGYMSAEYKLGLFYRDGRGVETDKSLGLWLLFRAAFQGDTASKNEFSRSLNDLDFRHSSISPHLEKILTYIVDQCREAGKNSTHSSWNDPDLLWSLYENKAPRKIFSFLRERQPLVFNTRDNHQKIILHRVLEEWNPLQPPSSWFADIFSEVVHNISDYEMVDDSGKNFLGLACQYKHTNPFRILVEKGAGKHIIPDDKYVEFYKYLLIQQRVSSHNEEIKSTVSAFKRLEQRNRDLKFKMAMEHILGGILTEEIYPPSSLTMIGTETGPRTLPQITRDQLCHPQTTKVHKINTEGRGTVARSTCNEYTLYFKFLPEIPGIESAVSLLTHELIGFGTSKSELFKIPHSLQVSVLKDSSFWRGEQLGEETIHDIPVLVSLGIEGPLLKKALETPIDPATGINILQNLDQDSLYAMILVAMLTNPEDGKSDNYVVEPFPTAEGLKYRLIGIDNDHAFVPAFAELSTTRVKINTKTVLYAFDEITLPIPKRILSHFKEITKTERVDALLKNWLSCLKDLSARHANIFVRKDNEANKQSDYTHICDLFDKYKSFIGIPFAVNSISSFYTKIIKLQNALEEATRDVSTLTPLNLFMKIEPQLKDRYAEALLRLQHMNVSDRFKAIEGNAAEVSISRPLDVLGSYKIPNNRLSRLEILEDRQYGPTAAIAEFEEIVHQTANNGAIQSGELESFRQLRLGHHIENALKTINFTTFSDPVSQSFLPEIQKKLGLITNLTLRNHKFFTTSVLRSWAKEELGRLTSVTLSGCHGIHKGGVVYLSQNLNCLEHLDLSQNEEIQTITERDSGIRSSLPLTFENLRYLDVSGCPQLSQIDLNAPYLRTLKVQGDQTLRLLKGVFSHLCYLDIRGIQALDNSRLTDFVLSNISFLKDVHIETDEEKQSIIKDAQRFLRGVLIYKPNKENDVGKRELPISDFLTRGQNPLESTFDLSGCGDAGKYLSISTGYRREATKSVNPTKWEVFITPKFLIEAHKTASASHYAPICNASWTAPFAVIQDYGGWTDINWYWYNTTITDQELNTQNLYEIYQDKSTEQQYTASQYTARRRHAQAHGKPIYTTWGGKFYLQF